MIDALAKLMRIDENIAYLQEIIDEGSHEDGELRIKLHTDETDACNEMDCEFSFGDRVDVPGLLMRIIACARVERQRWLDTVLAQRDEINRYLGGDSNGKV